eukprot:TRINITY_DN9153_c0_g1_i1.p1 TRINITY_DN9153_c0_g1~~TRINITY_DN9153_c0_g1_i1.p1  ORF type:complete len:124 (+),score=0.85 TRINITY_DN9153_c0_g1_i1:3-374(+)
MSREIEGLPDAEVLEAWSRFKEIALPVWGSTDAIAFPPCDPADVLLNPSTALRLRLESVERLSSDLSTVWTIPLLSQAVVSMGLRKGKIFLENHSKSLPYLLPRATEEERQNFQKIIRSIEEI